MRLNQRTVCKILGILSCLIAIERKGHGWIFILLCHQRSSVPFLRNCDPTAVDIAPEYIGKCAIVVDLVIKLTSDGVCYCFLDEISIAFTFRIEFRQHVSLCAITACNLTDQSCIKLLLCHV